jgi:micrococcal nuclease
MRSKSRATALLLGVVLVVATVTGGAVTAYPGETGTGTAMATAPAVDSTVSVGDGVVEAASTDGSDASPDPVCADCRAPSDPDGDGAYENVDGEGGVTFFDVLTLYDYFRSAETPAVEPYDFDDDGSLTFFDVLALYDEFRSLDALEAGVTVTVVEVVDGDTMDVRFPDGEVERVRLLGVDTPEVHTATDPAEWEGVPETDSGWEWLRDWGHKSSEFARTELAGTDVTVRTDPEADRRGGYGRLLVYLSEDGESFNRQLLDQGYARLYDTAFSKRATYASAEEAARANDVGVWGYEASEPSGFAVTEIHEDAVGNDHENLNDEYVEFTNTGDETLDLSGWTVSDEADHSYVFPDGFALGPGESVTLYTGSGTDGDTELYWGSGSAIWNNAGDTIVVTTDDGELALERTYT